MKGVQAEVFIVMGTATDTRQSEERFARKPER